MRIVAEFHNEFQGPNYGTINQAGHDINVTNVSSLQALAAAGELRAALAGVRLSADDSSTAHRELDEVERELRRPEPDREHVARRLETLASVLKASGALATAGMALAGPIGVLAGFLGPLGAAVVKLARA